MSFCTNCGTIMHQDDIEKHKLICIPVQKGKERRPTMTEVTI